MIKAMDNSPQAPSRFRSVAIFLMALSLGAAGVFYSRQYIENQVSTYKGEIDRQERTLEVIAPNRALRRGETVMAEDLQFMEIPEHLVDSGAVTELTVENVIGRQIEFDIDAGKPLLWAHLAGGVTPTFSGLVANGLRAMTVRVDEINSISGFLQPSDKVDLLLTHGKAEAQKIFPFLQNLDVIATGMQTDVDKTSYGATRNFATITVHVSPEDAQRITLAQQVGKITAVLRNPDDDKAVGKTALSVADLFDKSGVETPAPRRARSTSKKATRVPIEYIIGGQ